MTSIDHVDIRVSEFNAAIELYGRVFDLLEFKGACTVTQGFCDWGDFAISQTDLQHPPTTNLHVGFAARSHAQIDTWWRTLTDAGYTDDGPPGPRPEYGIDYYGAFIRDHDGNSIEAARHSRTDPATSMIDHIWIRVGDLDASKPFYTAIAPVVGITAHDRPGRLQLTTASGTVSVLADTPATANVHLAFGVDDNGLVDAFYEAGLAAGARDNGAPGERPRYHAGYYGAFLLDPDSNNIEAVCHNQTISMSATA